MKREDFNTLPPPVAAFLRYHDNLSHSKLTTANYANDLRLYFRYLAERHGLIPADLPPDAWEDIDLSAIGDSFLKGITLEETADFLAHCFYERDNNPRTRARKVVTIRRFFHYLTVNRHLLENNPMEELVSPKIGKTLPKYLSVEECRTLLGAVEGSFPERDSCILILFLNCGLRLSELCALNLRDIRHDEHILQIRGKGNKERTVHLNGACMAAIRRYLRVRPQDRVAQEDRDALFISRNNRRINQRSVQLMLEKLLEKTGLDGRGYSIHKLRHTAATLMYQNDVDVMQLKEILGHENLATTEIYTHVTTQQLRDAMDANPLSDYGTSQED